MTTPKKSLIRHCDRCLAATAIDLDNTPANAKSLRLRGQTVRIIDYSEAITLQLERCRCKTNAKDQPTGG